MLTSDQIKQRIHYHPPSEEAVKRHTAIREAIENVLSEICAVVPEGREQSLALTKAEEVMFWANAGIARNHDKL